MKNEENVLRDLINECKEDFLFFKDLGIRGFLFCVGILWSVVWMMAIDSPSTKAFLLSILFMLIGIVVSGLSFLSMYLEAKKETGEPVKRNYNTKKL